MKIECKVNLTKYEVNAILKLEKVKLTLHKAIHRRFL